MSLWDAIVLGFLQGATEFLPVSSSGHLVVGQMLLGLNISGVQFEVAVHVATLLSVVLVYRARILALARGAVSGGREELRYIGFIVVATLPVVAVGASFRGVVESLFESPFVPAAGFLVTGVLLWTTRAALARGDRAALGLVMALAIGVAQAFAVIPGVSRSGATVVMALWLGLKAEEAAEFSFLMAIPAIAGAAVLQIWGGSEPALNLAVAPMIVGAVVAGVTGVLAIRVFVVFLARRRFHRFAIYCWTLGVGFMAYLFATG